MNRPGWPGAGQVALTMAGDLRETAVAAVGRWRTQLAEASARGRPQECAPHIAQDAAQLRAYAISRQAPAAVVEHLAQVTAAASGPPGTLFEAIEQIARLLATPEPRLLDSMIAPSLAEPPLLDLSSSLSGARQAASPQPAMVPPSVVNSQPPAPQSAPPTEHTLLSGPGVRPSISARPPMVNPANAVGVPSVPAAPIAPPGPVSAVPPPQVIRPGPIPSPLPPALPPSMRPPPAEPNLVGTVLGLRAFGRKGGSSRAPAPAPAARSDEGGVLGLRARPRTGSSAVPGPAPLPADPSFGNRPQWQQETPRRLDRKRDGKRGSRSTGASRGRSVPPWFYAVGGGFVVLAVAAAALVARAVREPPKPLQPSPKIGEGATAGSGSAGSGGLPAAATSSGKGETTTVAPSASGDPLTALIQQRANETPELRALLDTQARQALSCRKDPSSCGLGWTAFSRDAFSPIDRSSLTLAPAAPGPLPPWLQHLKIPGDLTIRDERALRSMFDFNTKNIAGRQRFQAKIFDCAAYDDIFDSTLVKYGAPSWLSAVVFQESGCYPAAKSPVGAVGLWQFMPESARAYGLRVVDGEIDERLNPIKATDAAIHFLTDLHRTLGGWDLVLAAYNMGPFAVLARLAQVGENATFWDLAHAGLLPEETAGYVPAIEAYALAIQNLSRLQFSRDGKRLEATAVIGVKPGMRMSLIARAASTTTLHVRELNPEFLRDVVPEGETEARVPDPEAHRAQAFLESWSPDDSRDTCVPESFDWGAKEFESSSFAKACPQAKGP